MMVELLVGTCVKIGGVAANVVIEPFIKQRLTSSGGDFNG